MITNPLSEMILKQFHERTRKRFHSLGFQSKTLETKVGTLHFFVRNGEVGPGSVVLVHGLGTSSSTWLRTIPRLTDSRTLIALDLPGFGFSTVQGAQGFAAFREHQHALTEFLDALRGGPLTLVGHSFGGWLCARYAAASPNRVQHLVLVNSVGVYFQGIEQLREKFILKSVADTRLLLNAMWYRYPWYLKPLTGAIHRELTRRQINELVASIGREDLLVEELERLTMPVSLIWGRNDGIIPPEAADTLLRAVPRARIFFIERCGHVPQLERPQQFAAVFHEALRRVP